MNIISKVKYNKRFKDYEKPTEDAIVGIRPVSIDHIHKRKVEPISRNVHYPYFKSIFGQNKYIFSNGNLNFLNMTLEMKPTLNRCYSFTHLRYHYHCSTNVSNILYSIIPIHSIKKYCKNNIKG
jgi:hypothetical protein